MKIGIIGNGFVGSAILHGFILHVEDILIYDKDPQRSTHGLEEVVDSCNVIFLCVPTPMYETGECDLSIVHDVVSRVSTMRHPQIGERVVAWHCNSFWRDRKSVV